MGAKVLPGAADFLGTSSTLFMDVSEGRLTLLFGLSILDRGFTFGVTGNLPDAVLTGECGWMAPADCWRTILACSNFLFLGSSTVLERLVTVWLVTVERPEVMDVVLAPVADWLDILDDTTFTGELDGVEEPLPFPVAESNDLAGVDSLGIRDRPLAGN